MPPTTDTRECLSGDDRDALLDALETLSVAVTVLDAEGRLLFASDGLNRLFRGLPPWPDLVGRSYEEIVRLGVPEVAACALGDDAKTFLALRFSRLGRRTRVPLTVPLADGRVIAIRARPRRQGGTVLVWSEKRPGPEPDAAGAPALFSDPVLLRTLGHTLKTPLNAILGFSDLMATMADTLSPAQVREYARFFKHHFAGCADSFVNDTGVQVGVRQSRQLRGRATLRNEDVTRGTKFRCAIARSPWPIELHSGDKPRLVWLTNDYYEVPLDCFVPERGDGLLAAGRCLSAEHEAMASARVTAQCFSYGHAVGHAAAIAVNDKISPRAVDANEVRERLNRDGALL